MLPNIAKLYRLDVLLALVLMVADTLRVPVPKEGEPLLRDATQVALLLVFWGYWQCFRPVRLVRYLMPLSFLFVGGQLVALFLVIARAFPGDTELCYPAYLLAFWVAERTLRAVSKRIGLLWVDEPEEKQV